MTELFAGCSARDMQLVFPVVLVVSFGWKALQLRRRKRDPRVVYRLVIDGEASERRPMSATEARGLNRQRKRAGEAGRWEPP